ncbi:hypothetical protein CYMTET_53455 [Cymbomonas tetramitiformis]|uniref:O-GlcNAc transferase C-terminal domain-containing protein n=1 Tax=Cymbomonas tetramitiformis TaxID=36881 RepID=A0AAE0BIA3_9CHLO|nr:hypothetical protein CYMTET_53455 [Cymbomonas tetramitiformis]
MLCEEYVRIARQEIQMLGLVNRKKPKKPKKGLRVGYFSSDFGNAPVGRLFASVPSHHSSGNSVTPLLYVLNPPDGSYYRHRVEEGAATVVPLAGLTNQNAAQRINADDVHILVDLLGFTAGGYAMQREHILALTPAPVIVNFLGYPGTSGARSTKETTQYAVVDRVIVTPEMQPQFTEQLLYMPHSYQVNDMAMVQARADVHQQQSCSRTSTHCARWTRRFDTWLNIVHRVPHSVLWLLRLPSHAAETLLQEAAARGLKSRVVFGEPLPPEQHLLRCALADLFLDSLQYNAHTTATDALWAGVPIITLPGGMMQSRVAAGLIEAIGVKRCTSGSLFRANVIRLRSGSL